IASIAQRNEICNTVRGTMAFADPVSMKRLSPRCGDNQRGHISAPDRTANELRQAAPVNSAEIRGASRRMSANYPTTRWNARAQGGTRSGWGTPIFNQLATGSTDSTH